MTTKKYKLKKIFFLLLIFTFLPALQIFDAYAMRKVNIKAKSLNRAKVQNYNKAFYQKELEKMASFIHKNIKLSHSGIKKKSSKSQILSNPNFNLSKLSKNGFNTLGLEVYKPANSSIPHFVKVKNIKGKRDNMLSSYSDEDLAKTFINDHSDLFKLDNAYSELKFIKGFRDEQNNSHLRFQQTYKDIPVWGKQITIHLDKYRNVYMTNGRNIKTPDIVLTETFNPKQAIAIAQSDIKHRTKIEKLSTFAKKLLNYTGPGTKKYWWQDSKTGEIHLIWFVQIRPNIIDKWYYFIDAIDGSILEAYNSTNDIEPATGQGEDYLGVNRTFNVELENGMYYMIDQTRDEYDPNSSDFFKSGVLATFDQGEKNLFEVTPNVVVSATNIFTDKVAVSTHYNMALTYEYYKNTYGRKSLDDDGMSMIGIIHVEQDSKSMANAYWNGSLTVFGDGGSVFHPLGAGLDVVAHEFTHAVLQFSGGLEYKFQSGALNEAIADWGGSMVDDDDWLMGEDVAKPLYFPSGAMRDMENPHNGASQGSPAWQPENMSEFVELTIDDDNGGVHLNSGIINKATSLIGTSIGRDKLGAIYYRVLKNGYLTTQAEFMDMRIAAVQAAEELYGDGSTEANAVKSAFAAVGLGEGPGSERDPDLPPITGDEKMAFINYELDNTEYANSLFMAETVIKDYQQDIYLLSENQAWVGSGYSVTMPDDGYSIFYIDDNLEIRFIDFISGEETPIPSQILWNSIAISPDATMFAAVPYTDDPVNNPAPFILILDLNVEDGDSTKLVELYTPTTGTEKSNEQPLMIDAVEWNSSGDYLIYDALNQVNLDTTNYHYWEWYLLDQMNEVVTRVFSEVSQGTAIGNPSFSKTNDDYVAFDYVNSDIGEHYIVVGDLYTGNLGSIIKFDEDAIYSGYPKFSLDDSKLIFHYLNEDDKYDIYTVGLDDTRLNYVGDPVYYVNDAVYPRWFAIGGHRTTDVHDIQNSANISVYNYPNPAKNITQIFYETGSNNFITVSIYDINGKEVNKLEFNKYVTAGTHSVAWNTDDFNGEKLPPGNYYCRIISAGNSKNTSVKTLPITILR